LTECFEKRRSALAKLADAARRVDRAGFGAESGFAQAHQALLETLETVEILLES
jgi:hypothetical protein